MIPFSPSPSGKGSFVVSCKGCRPLHPCACAGNDTAYQLACGAGRDICPRVIGSTCLRLNFLPPSPRPPSPPGKGEIFSFFLQGASPLATPRLNPRDTAFRERFRYPAPAPERHCVPGGLRRREGLAPALPALSCLRANRLPPSPPRPPSPPGKGEIFSFFLQGALPLATPRLNPRDTAFRERPGNSAPVPERHCVPDSLRYPKTHAGSGTGFPDGFSCLLKSRERHPASPRGTGVPCDSRAERAGNTPSAPGRQTPESNCRPANSS